MAIIDVIAYEGDNNTLVYKYPHTEFNTLSQLIVHESQEAVFFRNGQMLDSFPPGKYTLHTGNIPLLSKLINLPTGGESPFRCEVYFVNKALALNYKWGTKSKTRVWDNQFQLLLEIGASGTMGLKVTDPRVLLGKIVGTEAVLTAEECLNYFRENVSARIKVYLACVMKKPEMSFLLLETYLNDFSTAVQKELNEVFSDVGVEVYNFVIGTIQIPDEQYNVIMSGQQRLQHAQYEKKLKKLEAEGDAEAQTIRAGGRAKSRQIEGYNWADEQVAEITKTYAANANVQQNPANMIAQAPMALAFGNMLRGNVEPIMGMTFSNPPQNFGPHGQGQPQNDPSAGMFGIFEDISPDIEEESGKSQSGEKGGEVVSPVSQNETLQKQSADDEIAVVQKLKKMLDMGLISQQKYDAKVEEVLKRMCNEGVNLF